MKVDLELAGDHFDGIFTLFWCRLKRGEHSVNIYLSAEQMNAATKHDDPFEAVLGLQNILADSGFTVLQTITVENGDGSKKESEFVTKFNEITHEPFEEFAHIEINITDYGNIKLASAGGYEFIINCEPFDLNPTDIIENLKSIFNLK
tara:strand:+ start:359 stop:802 length:444 start_codon:yes stop_codon:yes gene_type:complete